MTLPEDEAKETLEPEEKTLENEVLEQVEVENGDVPSDQQDSVDEEVLSGEEAFAAALLEVEKFRDLALRAEAEMQNLQRRTARDVENAHKFGVEKFVLNMLPVVDSLEKAIESTSDKGDAIAEGLRLCHKLMVDTLAKEGVEIIDPVGEPFDPNQHQAMSMVENPDM
jgi:molecular chaperone GrpE